MLKGDYLEKIKSVGFKVKILSETKNLTEQQTCELDFESLNIEATKSN
ncbi:MAG: hypothetical protein JXA38_04515 [Methanosarcinaceae archaeon]|nr:hypothetical protein [Methanosarcinaceae archaeon]